MNDFLKFLGLILAVIGGIYIFNHKEQVVAQISGRGTYIGQYTLIEQSEIPMLPEPRIEVLSVTMTVGDTPQRLPYGRPAHGYLKVTAPSTNTSSVYIASDAVSCKTGPRYILEAESTQNLSITEISSLWMHGDTSGDTLSIFSEIMKGGSYGIGNGEPTKA